MGDKISLIKKGIRTLDFFGESFTFTFKDNDKHSTLLGGIVCILFFIIAFLYLIGNVLYVIKIIAKMKRDIIAVHAILICAMNAMRKRNI